MTGIFNNLSHSAFLTKVILMSGLRHKLAKRDTRIEHYSGIKEFDICLLKSVRYRQAERGWFFHTVRNRTKVKQGWIHSIQKECGNRFITKFQWKIDLCRVSGTLESRKLGNLPHSCFSLPWNFVHWECSGISVFGSMYLLESHCPQALEWWSLE